MRGVVSEWVIELEEGDEAQEKEMETLCSRNVECACVCMRFIVCQVEAPVFRMGDVIRIMDDDTEVSRMQKGHGEWNEAMSKVTLHSL